MHTIAQVENEVIADYRCALKERCKGAAEILAKCCRRWSFVCLCWYMGIWLNPTRHQVSIKITKESLKNTRSNIDVKGSTTSQCPETMFSADEHPTNPITCPINPGEAVAHLKRRTCWVGFPPARDFGDDAGGHINFELFLCNGFTNFGWIQGIKLGIYTGTPYSVLP